MLVTPIHPVSSLQFADLQGDIGKMQGEPNQKLSESHCAVRSWSTSPYANSRVKLAGLQGTAGLQKSPIQSEVTAVKSPPAGSSCSEFELNGRRPEMGLGPICHFNDNPHAAEFFSDEAVGFCNQAALSRLH
jgi:hypothetical protein